MPRNDYTEDAQTALELITEFGLPSTFVEVGKSLADPDKPWEITTVDINHPCEACLIPLTSEDAKLFPDLTVVNNMQRAFVDAVNFSEIPKMGDKVIHDNVTWQVKSINPLKPATVNVFWDMAVGK